MLSLIPIFNSIFIGIAKLLQNEGSWIYNALVFNDNFVIKRQSIIILGSVCHTCYLPNSNLNLQHF